MAAILGGQSTITADEFVKIRVQQRGDHRPESGDEESGDGKAVGT